MTTQEQIEFWVGSSDDNYKSMLNMFDSGEYMWSLFVGHLAIEKLLKAYYVKIVNSNVPRTHDLLKLAVSAGLDLDEGQKDVLQYITLFNIEARYEGYKKDFYKKCDKGFAERSIGKIEDIRRWLKEEIQG